MNEAFGQRIKSLRKEKNLTLKELSDKSGIALTYLSKIENGKTGGNSAEVSTIEKLAHALGVDANTKDELFRLGKQIPPDIKDKISQSKLAYKIYRSFNDLNEKDILRIVDEIKKRKSQGK